MAGEAWSGRNMKCRKSGKLAGVMADEAGSVKFDGGSWKKSGKYSGTGEYGDVGDHHVHAKAGFKGAKL